MVSLSIKATRQHTKDHNYRLVLRTIYDYGQISRASLARLTHLTRATVSEVVGELIAQGLVEEIGSGPSAVGRAPILLSVVDDARHVLAVDITSRAVSAALVNLRGVVCRRTNVPLDRQNGADTLDRLYQALDELVRGASRPLLGIGISAPGLIDVANGIVRRAVNFGWHDLPLRSLLHARYRLPVYIANDSHTVALAEYMFGQHHGSENLVVIKVGRGVGAGIVIGGRLFYGDGHGAGEIGHVVVVDGGPECNCGNQGCLEALVSSRAIAQRAREIAQADLTSPLHRFAGDLSALDLEAVLQAFLAGDPAARQIAVEVGGYLGIAVANMVGVLNIQRVVVAGRIAPFGKTLRDAIVQEVSRRVLPLLAQATDISVIALGPDTSLLGASALLLTYELGLVPLGAHAQLVGEPAP